jgi:tRNA(Leu) C34 or U34 (ribose-2'-O)-methylase TrmL
MLLITEWNAGVASKLESHTNSDFASLNLTLSAFIVKFEVLREYNFSLLSQSQLTTLFYN